VRKVEPRVLALSLVALTALVVVTVRWVRDRPDELVWTDDVPVMQYRGPLRAAAAGSTLVLVNSDLGEGRELTALRPDGRWARLPDPADYEMLVLFSVGSTAMIAGTRCGGEYCEEHHVELARLSADLRRWSVFEKLPASGGEASVWASTGAHEVAVVGTARANLLVREDGTVREVPNPDGVRCVAGDQLVRVVETAEGAETPSSGVERLDTDDLDAGWQPGADPPGDPGQVVGGVCSATGMLFLARGIETSYDATTDRWTQRPGDQAVVALDRQPVSAAGDHAAVGPDGALQLLGIGPSDRTVTRAPDGSWSDTGLNGHHLVATSAGVWIFWRGEPDPTLLT